MIQVMIREDDPLGQFIDAKASYSGRNPVDVADEEIRNGFYALVRELHAQFMSGELSQGAMAAELGINRVDLIHLLEALDLPVTNL
jgi:hypothetical protein